MARLWILGPESPAINVIEALLQERGELVAYKTFLGERVTAEKAHSAEEGILLISFSAEAAEPPTATVRRIVSDRTRPPAEFLPASSIGQVIEILADEEDGNLVSLEVFADPLTGPHFQLPQWLVVGRDPEDGTAYAEVSPWIIEGDTLLAAAADHCLLAAYRGECPGVDPDALLQWRAEQIAKGEGRSAEAVLADIERARRILRGLPRLCSTDRGDDPLLWTGTPDVVDLALSGRVLARRLNEAVRLTLIPAEDAAAIGESGVVPELDEGAAREGMAYLAITRDPDGRERVVLGAATPEQVAWFVDEYAPQARLVEAYGDPAAGVAGGYLPAK